MALSWLAAGLVACSADRPAEPRDLSMVWISLDTLRADHLSLYGYGRETSPFLDRLAREGAYVEWAITPQSSTLPSHMAQFTGYHPVVHGVRHTRRTQGLSLREGVRTLPLILAEAGFRTRAWTDGGQMAGAFGFARGFESYDDAPGAFPDKLDAALEAIGTLRPDERFFFFLHTYEIHSPYSPPEAYRDRFSTPGEAEIHELARDRYDGSIRFCDDEIARFVAGLDALGRLGDTVLVVTGDHGENFAEYGTTTIGHGNRILRQNVTRVPWIVSHPGPSMRGRTVDWAGLEDFGNTVLALLDVDERLPGAGRSIFDEPPGAGRAYVSWSGPSAWSIYRDGLHYVESKKPGTARNGLFDVASDPAEQVRIEAPARVEAMARALDEARGALLADAERLQATLLHDGTLSDETRDQLRALGYAVDDPGEGAPAPSAD